MNLVTKIVPKTDIINVSHTLTQLNEVVVAMDFKNILKDKNAFRIPKKRLSDTQHYTNENVF